MCAAGAGRRSQAGKIREVPRDGSARQAELLRGVVIQNWGVVKEVILLIACTKMEQQCRGQGVVIVQPEDLRVNERASGLRNRKRVPLGVAKDG